ALVGRFETVENRLGEYVGIHSDVRDAVKSFECVCHVVIVGGNDKRVVLDDFVRATRHVVVVVDRFDIHAAAAHANGKVSGRQSVGLRQGERIGNDNFFDVVNAVAVRVINVRLGPRRPCDRRGGASDKIVAAINASGHFDGQI